MDKAGVAKAAIVQASTAYGHDNSYVADAVAAYPRRFTGVFSVDVLAPDATEKMKFWIDRGLSGMRLFTTGSTMPGQATWFDDPRSFPAWEYAGTAGIPVCMQMTPARLSAAARAARAVPVMCASSWIISPGRSSSTGHPMPRTRISSTWRVTTTFSSKLTPLNVSPATWGKATPETFFGTLIVSSAQAASPGGRNFPATDDTLAGILGKAQAALRVGRRRGSRLDFRQDRAATLSKPHRLTAQP